MSKLIKLYTLRYAFYYMSIIDNAVKKQNTTTALIKGLFHIEQVNKCY